MPDRIPQPAPRYVATGDAAILLGLSPRTLEKYRCHGAGPTFRKLGGRVVYALDDLEDWARRSACQSTSDPSYADARAVGQVGKSDRFASGAGRSR